MRLQVIACVLAGLCAPAAAPARATALTRTAAQRALSADLARAYGIRRVTATCARRTASSFSCRWRGSAGSGAYRGRALVRRVGGRTIVSLSGVRRVP